MPEPPVFEAARGLASSCSTGSIVEVFEGKDGTFVLMFTATGREEKMALRLSREAFARPLAIGYRLLTPAAPEETPIGH